VSVLIALSLEGLVEVCLWRKDAVLTAQVVDALQTIEVNQESWVRKWARPLVERLLD
jgi:hypothetical protein